MGHDYIVHDNDEAAREEIAERTGTALDFLNNSLTRREKEDMLFYIYRIIAPQPNTREPDEVDMRLFFEFAQAMGFEIEESMQKIQAKAANGGMGLL